MSFNEDPAVSCDRLPLYQGELTLLPHEGPACSGVGTVELYCGAATRHLRVRFEPAADGGATSFPSSADGTYGRGTSFARLHESEPFYLFVTSGGGTAAGEVIGESQVIEGDGTLDCDQIEVYLLNCLTPGADMLLSFGDWVVSSVRTRCAYNLTRLSLPTAEINLTHKLTISRAGQGATRWRELAPWLSRLLLFLSFANRSVVCAPVVYGYQRGELCFFRFETPRRTVPTNRRSWATNISQSDLRAAQAQFFTTMEDEFWASVLERSIDWECLAEASLIDSPDQALFTVQMLLELLSFVRLVEESSLLGEPGYGKLPAADKITLLCSRSEQVVRVQDTGDGPVQTFCQANSVNTVGELIAVLRNKLTHPTKRNREYLDRVAPGVRYDAVQIGQQIAALTILRVIGYRGMYHDILDQEAKMVPWVTNE